MDDKKLISLEEGEILYNDLRGRVESQSIPKGGSAGQVLVKKSSKDYKAMWRDLPKNDDAITSIIVDNASALVQDKTAYVNTAMPHFRGSNFSANVTNANFQDAIYATIEGLGTSASGNMSHAEGHSTNASGTSAHAEGDITIASAEYSHAEGYSTAASGDASHAEGHITTASGEASHAEGDNTQANGMYSHSEGSHTSATGNCSHAEGKYVIAMSGCAHAEGENTSANGESSHAEGCGTIADAIYSHSEGRRSAAIGIGSHAEGGENNQIGVTLTLTGGIGVVDYTYTETVQQYRPYTLCYPLSNGETIYIKSMNTSTKTITLTRTITPSSSITNSIVWFRHSTAAYGVGSHAEGCGTYAGTLFAHAEGLATAVTGDYGHAEGQNTTASTSAHSEGTGSTASGSSSHAEGYHTRATGQHAHAEGDSTFAPGSASHAEGYQTVAKGNYSHVQGRGTYVYGKAATAIGEYNLRDDYARQEWVSGTSYDVGDKVKVTNSYRGTVDFYTCKTANSDTSFNNGKWVQEFRSDFVEIVGNGTDEYARSNARTLDWDGNEWLAGKISVGTVASPTPVTNANDLTTKAYVDNAVAGVTVPVQDVQVNGVSVLTDGVANMPIADGSNFGVVKPHSNAFDYYGGALKLKSPGADDIKAGNNGWKALTPAHEHSATFYGLAKAAGDTTQSQSDNAIGTYTNEAKAAIQQMLDVPSNSDVSVYATKADTVLETTLSLGRRPGGAIGPNSISLGKYLVATGNNAFASGNYGVAYGPNSIIEGQGELKSVKLTGAANSTTYTSNAFLPVGSVCYLSNSTEQLPVVIQTQEVNEQFVITFDKTLNIDEALNEKKCQVYTHAAIGSGSHVEGCSNIALGLFQHIEGKHSVPNTNQALIIGNGTANNARSNAYALTWTGDGRYAGDVYVHCNSDSTDGTKLLTAADLSTYEARIAYLEAEIKSLRQALLALLGSETAVTMEDGSQLTDEQGNTIEYDTPTGG